MTWKKLLNVMAYMSGVMSCCVHSPTKDPAQFRIALLAATVVAPAIFNASGARVRDLSITAEAVKGAMKA